MHSPYANNAPNVPAYAHHMPPPSSQVSAQQQAKASGGSASRADYNAYAQYPHAQPPMPSPQQPQQPPALQQRPRAPSFDARVSLPPPTAPQPQQQQAGHAAGGQYPYSYASSSAAQSSSGGMHAGDGSAGGAMGMPGPVSGSASLGGSGVSTTILLMSSIYDDLVHELVLDLCFAVHKQEKTAAFQPRAGYDGSDVDVFGQVLKKIPDAVFKCELCHRSIGSGKFAPHLEKCMGKGRNGSRAARRKTIDYNENAAASSSSSQQLDDQPPLAGRQYSGSAANGHNVSRRTPTPPVPQHTAPGSGGHRYSSSSGYYQQQPPLAPPPPPAAGGVYRQHGDSDAWMPSGLVPDAYAAGAGGGYGSHPSTPSSTYPPPLSHPGHGDYQLPSLPSLPSPSYPHSSIPSPIVTSGLKRRLSPPGLGSPPPSGPPLKRPPSRGRPPSASSAASSPFWTDPLPSLLPHHANTGGYPHLLFPPSLPPDVPVPSPHQVSVLMDTVCGVVVGGGVEGKMCCHKRDGCQQHSAEEKDAVRRKLHSGEMEVRIKRAIKTAKAQAREAKAGK